MVTLIPFQKISKNFKKIYKLKKTSKKLMKDPSNLKNKIFSFSNHQKISKKKKKYGKNLFYHFSNMVRKILITIVTFWNMT